MVDEPDGTNAVFRALANDVRRDILHRLSAGPLTIGELAQPLPMSLAAASKHVMILEKVGLIQRTVMGRQHVCRLQAGPLARAYDWLRFYEHYWPERLDALEREIQATKIAEKEK